MTIPVILALIIAGFILKLLIKKDWLFNFIGILANDILLSFFILASIAGRSLAYLVGLKEVFFYVAAVILICLVSSYIYGRFFIREDRGWRGALMVLSIFPNTAALGFPLVAVFTRDLTPAILYSAASSLLAIPLATFLTIRYSRDSNALKETVARTFSFPPVTVSLLSLILVLGGLRLPPKLINLSQAIGWWCLPLMLVYFGSRLQFKNIPLRKILETGLFRMMLPFIFLLFALRTSSEAVFYSILVESAMPPAIMAASILARHQLKAEESTAVTLVLTLAAILLIFILKISGWGGALAGR
ncbi:MAG: transporter [Candidatus Saccharicenans sp.]|nr:transporter [Candidatus Saccharicenans sp.]MDH7493466.1 transporter [Candidatus Saccharicenans sp.]